ncbi:ATP-binding protein [Nonomuraea spiralis]|uniref:ATP-binding protein n=1 Tax=Nonomuraea spiralis TaxID=46182 RepID=A0ABV5IQ77_9ACTN|nr:ATP-binding protein [Nonomuraea spiralis]GGT11632.1 ATPase AAA [Nonomuraea spiralis]
MTRPYADNFEHLADELDHLDRLIRARLEAGRPEPDAAARSEIDGLLSRPDAEASAGDGPLDGHIVARVERSLAEGVWLALPTLSSLFGLSALETRIVVICLAPELRRKYDRLYAHLQDDITRRRPSVDLILHLLCPSEHRRWAVRSCFSENAPLLRTGILQAVADPASPSGSSGLAQFLKVDPRICHFLMGLNELDASLVGKLRQHDGQDVGHELADGVLRLIKHHWSGEGRPIVFHLHGPAGSGKLDLAAEVCRHLEIPLLSADAGALDTGGLLRTCLREGVLHQAAIHLPAADTLPPALLAELREAVADFGRLTFLTGEHAWDGGDFPGALFHSLAMPAPDPRRAVLAWREHLGAHTGEAREWAEQLVSRFRLPPRRIGAALALADNQRLMEPDDRPLALADVAAACRGHLGGRLDGLAVRIDPARGWRDLVLPEDRANQLRAIGDQVRHDFRVHREWGFRRGGGLTVLFSGPPGTGKTMAAEVLAHDLDLDLYKVDLSGVVSKYVGETEKNLARVFHEAWAAHAILFFDEADALFGKRTQVSDAHDRYANIETGYLLQKLDDHEGMVILATNLRQNLDEAFTRRLRFIVEFPFPEVDSRSRIWRTSFPPHAPVAPDVDFDELARRFPLSGGNIANVVLNAAFLAAADGGGIERRHILLGARTEFEKIGKLWPGDER